VDAFDLDAHWRCPMKWSMAVLAAAAVLLLLADGLAFHDLFEPHTARDWMMLVASILVVVGLAGTVTSRLRTSTVRG
jgi:hypothetical protein